MKKILFTLSVLFFTFTYARCQTIEEKVHQQSMDPSIKKNEAMADLRVLPPVITTKQDRHQARQQERLMNRSRNRLRHMRLRRSFNRSHRLVR